MSMGDNQNTKVIRGTKSGSAAEAWGSAYRWTTLGADYANMSILSIMHFDEGKAG